MFEPSPLLIDEHAAAALLGMSVAWLRKDRRGRRLIPFCRLGGSIRYNPGRIVEALRELEEGGAAGGAPRKRASPAASVRS